MSMEFVGRIGTHGKVLAWFAKDLRRHRLPYVVLFGFVLAVLFLATLRGDSLILYVAEYSTRIIRAVALVVCAMVVLACVTGLVRARHGGSPISIAIASLRGVFLTSMSARFLYGCVMFALFMGAFLYCKMMIPLIQPFSWDATFADWDRALLFGIDPWRLLHPAFGTPWMTFLLDVLYSSWVPAVFIFWAGLLASPRVSTDLRSRYWLATMVSWVVIGIVMATAFSSAGPCYFVDVAPTIPSPYTELVAYIKEVDRIHYMSSSTTKAFLWDVYTGKADLPGGISAMPSMHNAQAALFVTAAYSINRRFGHFMLAYAVLIFIASIHLGWHYAVDGIVGVAAALVIWVFCGALLRRDHGAPK